MSLIKREESERDLIFLRSIVHEISCKVSVFLEIVTNERGLGKIRNNGVVIAVNLGFLLVYESAPSVIIRVQGSYVQKQTG